MHYDSRNVNNIFMGRNQRNAKGSNCAAAYIASFAMSRPYNIERSLFFGSRKRRRRKKKLKTNIRSHHRRSRQNGTSLMLRFYYFHNMRFSNFKRSFSLGFYMRTCCSPHIGTPIKSHFKAAIELIISDINRRYLKI